MSLDERDFFNSRNETRTDKLSCPRCKRVNEYQMRWVVNSKKDRLPGGADERDRALYAKLRDYMVRVDDAVTCKTCGKKFDIPSQHSMVFIEKGGGAEKVYTGGDDEDSKFNRCTESSASGRRGCSARTRRRSCAAAIAPRTESRRSDTPSSSPRTRA